MKTHEMCVVIRWMVVGRAPGTPPVALDPREILRSHEIPRLVQLALWRLLPRSEPTQAAMAFILGRYRAPCRNASIGAPWRLASSGVTTPIAASRGDPRTTSSAAHSCAGPLCGLRLKRGTQRPHVNLALGRRHHQDGNCGSAQNGFGYQIERARA